jgi:hypothetical protein
MENDVNCKVTSVTCQNYKSNHNPITNHKSQANYDVSNFYNNSVYHYMILCKVKIFCTSVETMH